MGKMKTDFGGERQRKKSRHIPPLPSYQSRSEPGDSRQMGSMQEEGDRSQTILR